MTTCGHESLQNCFYEIDRLFKEVLGQIWSHIYFEENSVMVTDAWDEVTCLDEAADGRKYKI